jgi:serine/threonine-protein kinase RsbW
VSYQRTRSENLPHGGDRARDAGVAPLPLWWSREFAGEPAEVGRARAWVSKLLPACDPLDELLIITSEFCTNAVAHTRSGLPGGRFTAEVTWSPQAARVIVGDQGSDEIPAAAANAGGPADDMEDGRGLLLVSAMSAAWGTVGDRRARWLWADVHWRSRGGPLPTTTVRGNDPRAHLAAAGHAGPGASTWYGEESTHWHAALPEAGGTLTAPSPAALGHMLAARCPSARITIG